MLNADWLLFNASIFLTMTRRIAVVPGDGIGKEVIPNALEVVRATGASVEFTTFDWGADRYLIDGTTIPADGFHMLARDFDAVFVGALGDPRVPTNIHAKEILLGMRFKMDLYANVRPVRRFPLPAEERHARRHQLHRHPRKHRRRLHGHGRQLQDGHAGRSRHPGGHQYP
jgi:isocitrate/isopropylmalate dehydrogenase